MIDIHCRLTYSILALWNLCWKFGAVMEVRRHGDDFGFFDENKRVKKMKSGEFSSSRGEVKDRRKNLISLHRTVQYSLSYR